MRRCCGAATRDRPDAPRSTAPAHRRMQEQSSSVAGRAAAAPRATTWPACPALPCLPACLPACLLWPAHEKASPHLRPARRLVVATVGGCCHGNYRNVGHHHHHHHQHHHHPRLAAVRPPSHGPRGPTTASSRPPPASHFLLRVSGASPPGGGVPCPVPCPVLPCPANDNNPPPPGNPLQTPSDKLTLPLLRCCAAAVLLLCCAAAAAAAGASTRVPSDRSPMPITPAPAAPSASHRSVGARRPRRRLALLPCPALPCPVQPFFFFFFFFSPPPEAPPFSSSRGPSFLLPPPRPSPPPRPVGRRRPRVSLVSLPYVLRDGARCRGSPGPGRGPPTRVSSCAGCRPSTDRPRPRRRRRRRRRLRVPASWISRRRVVSCRVGPPWVSCRCRVTRQTRSSLVPTWPALPACLVLVRTPPACYAILGSGWGSSSQSERREFTEIDSWMGVFCLAGLWVSTVDGNGHATTGVCGWIFLERLVCLSVCVNVRAIYDLRFTVLRCW